MMDVSEILEGNKISVEYVSNLAVEQRVGVLTQAEDSKGEYGKFPRMLVSIAGREKYWNMNIMSIQAFAKDHGVDSNKWIGLKVQFTVATTKQGRPTLLGVPA